MILKGAYTGPFIFFLAKEKEMIIKGYVTPEGYMGFIDGSYILFATEDEYLEIVEDSREKRSV